MHYQIYTDTYLLYEVVVLVIVGKGEGGVRKDLLIFI